MSNEKQQTSTNAAAGSGRARGEGIACKMIRFVASEDVPGSEMQNTLTGRAPGKDHTLDVEGKPKICHHEIEFQPWQRHYRVTYFDRSKDGATRTLFIHETRVRSYEAW